MSEIILKKIVSFTLSLALLLQSFTPFIVTPVYADDSTPSATTTDIAATPELTPTPTDTPTITPDITPVVEITPTIIPTDTPTVTPTPTEEVTPSITPTPVATPEATPTVTITPTPTSQPQLSVQSNNNDSPTPTPTPTPTPSTPKTLIVVSQLEQPPIVTPTISTDKSDYFPTDTAYISGNNFAANTTYTLHISSADMPMVSYDATITTDASGHFIYAYQLDGNYRPNYLIEVKNSSDIVVASLTFKDSSHLDSVIAGAQTPNPIHPGNSATYAISFTSNGNHSQLANLSVTGLPSGATASFSPNPVDIDPPAQTSTLTIHTTGSTPAGTSNLIITAVADSTKTTTATLVVASSDTTKPVITLTGTSPVNVEINSAYVDSGATALDNIDGNLTSSIITVNPVNINVLGSYVVTYDVTDSSGNHATQVTRTVNVVDTTAPTVPTNGLPNGNVIPTNNFDFTWDASTDASAIHYIFQATQNPTSVSGVLTTGLWISGSLSSNTIHSSGAADGLWYWQVKAIDSLGNQSAWSPIWTVTIDTIAPTATINYSITAPTSGDVTATLVPSEAVTITNNGGSSNYLFTTNDSFTFNFVDAAGNTGSATATVTNIDKSAPPIPAHVSPADDSYFTTANLNLIDWAPVTDDANNPVTYIYQSSLFNTTNPDGSFVTPAYTSGVLTDSQISTSGTPEGVYYWHVKAVDTLGNASAWSTPWKVTVDNTAPVITINPYILTPTNSDIPVNANTNEGSLNFSSYVFSSNGSFDFVATDLAGNTTTQTVTITNIDKEAPIVSFTDPIDGNFVKGSRIITFSDSESTNPQCSIDGSVFVSCNYGVTTLSSLPGFDALPDGVFTLYLQDTDIAGNTGTSQITLTKDTTAPTTTDDIDGAWHNGPVTVHLNCNDGSGSGCDVIFWTTDGSDPTTSSSTGDTVNLTGDGVYTIKYFSQDAQGNAESIKTANNTVNIDTTAPTAPVATPPAGDYLTDQSVTLSSDDGIGSGIASIYYTTDGTDPATSLTRILYTGAITVDRDMTITAIAYDNVGYSSDLLTATYGIAPHISGESSTSINTTSAIINWTTDDPATSRVVYDTVSHPTLDSAPNYGYANSTVETDNAPKVLSHSVTINGLNPATTYYYRVISHGSPEATGDEQSFGTATVGGSGVSDGHSPAPSAPVCSATPPSSAPIFLSAQAGFNSVTLTWSKAADPVTYYLITYGTTPGSQQYGNPNVGGHDTTSYTINGLSGGIKYYFKIRAGNDCAPGGYSNEISATPTGGFVAGPANGFAPGVLGVNTTKEETITPTVTPTITSGVTPSVLGDSTHRNNWNWWWLLLLLIPGYFGYKKLGQK